MKVVMVKPYEEAKVVEITPTLENYQKIVNGYIECIYPFDDNVGLICNEEGKFGEEPNRALYHDGRVYDVVFGTFLVVGLTEDDFQSLTDEQAEKYRKLYERPEWFFKTRDGIAVMREGVRE